MVEFDPIEQNKYFTDIMTELKKLEDKNQDLTNDVLESIIEMNKLIKTQDKKNKNNLLEEKFKNALRKMDSYKREEFKEFVEKIHPNGKKWILSFQKVKLFVGINGYLPTQREEEIGSWSNTNRNNPIYLDFKKDKLTKEEFYYEKNFQELKEFVKNNDGFLPSTTANNQTEMKLGKWVNGYTTTSGQNEERQKIIREYVKDKTYRSIIEKEENFEEKFIVLKEFVENNEGFLPSRYSNNKTEKKLAEWISSCTQKGSSISEEKQEIMKEYVKNKQSRNKHEKEENFKKSFQKLKDFVENNDGFLPSRYSNNKTEIKLGGWVHNYTNQGSTMQKEKQEIIKEYVKEKERKKSIFNKDVNQIISQIEDIIITVGEEGNAKSVIPNLTQIIEIYEIFTEKEQLEFSRKSKEIKKYLDELLTRKEDIENLSAEEIIKIKESITETIQNNPTVKGAYLAMILKDSVDNGEKEKELMKEELYSLSTIMRFLKYKEKNIQEKDIIFQKFESYMKDNFFIERENGKREKIDFNGWVGLEIKSHFITFFENFNENDFEELKNKVINEGVDIFEEIITKINNSTISIAKNQKQQTNGVFVKKRNRWIYSPGSGGELDLFASYDKDLFVGSTTGLKNVNENNGRGEGKQLLLHPIKANSMLNETYKILQEEIETNVQKELGEGEYLFDEDSVFSGLKVKIEDNNIKVEKVSKDRMVLDYINDNMFDKMDNIFVLLKSIIETEKFGKRKVRKEKLLEYKDRLRTKYSQLKNSKKSMEGLGYNHSYHGTKKIENEVIENNFSTNYDKEINPIFDIPNLTQTSLDEENNKLLITLQLNVIRNQHNEFVDYDFIKHYQIRAPFIENYNVKLNDRLNLTKKIGWSLLEILKETKTEKYSNEVFSKKIFELFIESYPDTGIKQETINKINTNEHKELFKEAVKTYVRESLKTNQDREREILMLNEDQRKEWELNDFIIKEEVKVKRAPRPE